MVIHLNYLIIVIAISLSMDAFSLSLAYGTLNLDKKYIKKLSIIVGIYHFFMPIFGVHIGKFIGKIIFMNGDLLIFLVLTIIGFEMIIESFKNNKEIKIMKLFEILLFGFAVSIDSFSLGIGLKSLTSNVYIAALIFAVTSLIFTYIGLNLGKKINLLIGKISTILGGIVLIIIGTIYLF